MTRTSMAREFGLVHQRLTELERSGLMPPFGSIPSAVYRDRLTLILAARRKLTMQRVRAALAAGGC